jgi:hypothetical protein
MGVKFSDEPIICRNHDYFKKYHFFFAETRGHFVGPFGLSPSDFEKQTKNN